MGKAGWLYWHWCVTSCSSSTSTETRRRLRSGPETWQSAISNRAALTEEGLEVWFDELEVGPPAIGIPVALIPYDQLPTILDPEGPVSLFV